ncbi:MAG: iron ABC transporter permease, partial [Pseudomonadota bacterium]
KNKLFAKQTISRLFLWYGAPLCCALIVFSPLISLLAIAFQSGIDIWLDLAQTVLGYYIFNTVALMILTGIGVLIIGTYMAWLITIYRFPGQKWLVWFAILPLSLPAFLIAFIYTDLLEYAGIVQTTLRHILDIDPNESLAFPEIRSLGGAAIMMTLVLYPYVFIMARSSFIEQSPHLFEACRLLGVKRKDLFIKVAVPLARPAIVAGVSLALIETLSDFGTVDFFAVHTLSIGIFDTWYQRNNPGGAAQIALAMLSIVILILVVERYLRANRHYIQTTTKSAYHAPYHLSGFKAWGATILCTLPPIFGFLIPLISLFYDSIIYFKDISKTELLSAALNSFQFATLTALIGTMLALFAVFSIRLAYRNLWPRRLFVFSTVGYAIPGAVLAIAIVFSLAWFDQIINYITEFLWDHKTTLIISGTSAAVIIACTIRFLAPACYALLTNSDKISSNIDFSGRLLGLNINKTMWKIVCPSLRTGIFTAFILVFVEVMKELPITLTLRPLNNESLATLIYQYASDERFEQAAPGALAITLVGLIPVIILSKAITKHHYKT